MGYTFGILDTGGDMLLSNINPSRLPVDFFCEWRYWAGIMSLTIRMTSVLVTFKYNIIFILICLFQVQSTSCH